MMTVLLASLGCRDAVDKAPLVSLQDRWIFDGAARVVPGPRWQWSADDQVWSWRGFGDLLIAIPRQLPAEGGLVIEVHLDQPTSDLGIDGWWDDHQLGEEEFTRQKAEGGNDLLRIEPGPDRLMPGVHELRLRRRYVPGRQDLNQRREVVMPRVVFRSGGGEQAFDGAQRSRYGQFASHLIYGVTGRDPALRWSGTLVSLDRKLDRVTIDLAELISDGGRDGGGDGGGDADASHAAGSLVVEPRHLAGAASVITLEACDQRLEDTLEVASDSELRLPLAADCRQAQITVESLTVESAAGSTDEILTSDLLLAAARFEPAEIKQLPPVILITLDTTRRDALAPYGQERSVTPHLATFAERATVYEQAFSTAPWTLPSHASMFTGRYPSRHRAGVSEPRLPRSEQTLAHRLRDAGYFAAGFSAGELSSSRFGLAQGFHIYRNPERFESPGDEVIGHVEATIDRYGEMPLFLFINLFDPHAIYQAPEPYQQRLGVAPLRDKVLELPIWGDLARGDASAWRRAVEGEAEMTPEVSAYLRAAYLAEIAYVDDLLARLFAHLEGVDSFDRALIIITADHGEQLGEGGFVSHGGRLDPESVEIPLIVKWPHQVEAHRVRDLASLVDLYPTILATLGLEQPTDIDGRALTATPVDRRGGDNAGLDSVEAGHQFVVLEEHESVVHPLPEFMKVAPHLFGIQRPAARHLLWQEGESCAELTADGWRAADCRGDRQQIFDAITDRLRPSQGGSSSDSQLAADDAAMPDELRKSLEALGYL